MKTNDRDEIGKQEIHSTTMSKLWFHGRGKWSKERSKKTYYVKLITCSNSFKPMSLGCPLMILQVNLKLHYSKENFKRETLVIEGIHNPAHHFKES